jgi:hypothetical protein
LNSYLNVSRGIYNLWTLLFSNKRMLVSQEIIQWLSLQLVTIFLRSPVNTVVVILSVLPLCQYEFGYSFSLERFVRDVPRYYNFSLAHIHRNGWIILSLFEKLLRILNEEPSIKVFRQCYTLISSIEGDLQSLDFLPSSIS